MHSHSQVSDKDTASAAEIPIKCPFGICPLMHWLRQYQVLKHNGSSFKGRQNTLSDVRGDVKEVMSLSPRRLQFVSHFRAWCLPLPSSHFKRKYISKLLLYFLNAITHWLHLTLKNYLLWNDHTFYKMPHHIINTLHSRIKLTKLIQM